MKLLDVTSNFSKDEISKNIFILYRQCPINKWKLFCSFDRTGCNYFQRSPLRQSQFTGVVEINCISLYSLLSGRLIAFCNLRNFPFYTMSPETVCFDPIFKIIEQYWFVPGSSHIKTAYDWGSSRIRYILSL